MVWSSIFLLVITGAKNPRLLTANLAWSTELVQMCPMPTDLKVASHEGFMLELGR